MADDFWANVLIQQPPPQRPTSFQPDTDVPWWQRATVSAPASPTPLPAEGTQGSAEVDPQASMARTQWAKETSGACPNCMSTTYATHPEHPNAKPRCFECGYPLMQSGSGAAARGDRAHPVKEARQVSAARSNNFNPRQIVTHAHPQEG